MKILYFKKLLSALIFSGSGLFTLLFFSPLEVYLGNPSEFHVYADLAVIILLVAAAACTVIFAALISFLPTKILKFCNLGIFAVTVCFYLQAMLLNGELVILDGGSLQLSPSTKLVNGLLWLVVFGAVFGVWYLLKRCKKEKAFITVTKYMALALVLMQLTGIVSLYLGCDKAVNVSKSLYFSNEDELTVAKQKNVVYFVIDYCDGMIVQEALAQDPDMFRDFTGFTYYPNASFTHSRTYPAITYLLSGEKCWFDKPHTQYVDEVFQPDSYLAYIDKLGADVRVFTDTRYVGPSATAYIDNYKQTDSTKMSSVNIWGFLKETFKVSAFRGAPYATKSRFTYTTEAVNQASIVRQTDYAAVNDDLGFYENVNTKGVTVNQDYASAFRFYHMYGSHPGSVVNENAQYQENVTLPQALRGDLKIIAAYLQKLKDLGVYDETTVIITADHGHVAPTFSLPQTCLMLVKMAGDDSSLPVQTSQAPVCHDDLFATVIKGLGGDYTSYGPAIDEISETEERLRYHYNTVLEGGQEVLLNEYVISGDARDLNNYQATGKQWIIHYTI